MRAFSDPRYSTVVVVCGSQMGKTETIFNIIGHRMDDGPYVPTLYIGPTQKQVSSVSTDRIAKMLKLTPSLYEKLEKGHRDKTTEKFIAGVRLGFGWAGSATELASHPAGLVLLDELDRMDSDVGGEGDPVTLSRARTKNYPGSKLGVFSTPTVQGASPVWSLWEDGTCHKWAWPCPACHTPFVPTLALLWWPDKATPGEAREAARLTCPHCGSQIENKHKNAMNAAGEFIPHRISDNGEHVPIEQPIKTSTASFWISGLASPWVSFGDVAEIMVAAYRSHEQEKIQAAVNTYGGELFTTTGDAPEWESVLALRSTYRPATHPDFILPDRVQMITAGVDVQKNGLFYTVRGFGFMAESWQLESGFIPGETEFDNVWLLLARLREKAFGHRRIDRMFIDSGYRPGDKSVRPEHQVYAFCRRNHGWAFPTKGHDQQDRPLKPSMIDVTMGGRIIKNGVQLWHVDTDHFKVWLYARIRWPDGEAGGWHLHSEADEDYCAQVVSEELILKPSGRRLWKIRRGKSNHYLDCEILAIAAAKTLQVDSLPPNPEPIQTAPKVNPVSSQSAGGFINRPGGSWIRR